MIEVVVLLGPPGSGKSSVGEELGRRGLRWRDWEPTILARWGSRDAFVANKADAVPALHNEIREWIASDEPVAVVETTGLSDAPLVSTLDELGSALIVRLDVSEEEALRRVSDRAQGRHLSDSVDPNRQVWRAFQEHVTPHRRVDLVVDTEAHSVDATAATIVAAVEAVRP